MDSTNNKKEIRTIIIGDYTIQTYEIDYIKRIKNLYGFIYVTTNLLNGKKYVGQKKIDKRSKWKSYLGSGIALKESVEKYGKENFHREIIDIAFNKNELNNWERYYTILFNSVDDESWYNMCHGGGSYVLTEEQRKEMSERMKGDGNPMYGRKHTEEELKKLSERFSGENNPMYGKRGEDAPSYGKRGKDSPRYRDKNNSTIKVNQYALDDKFIKTFSSIVEAAELINRNPSNITNVCRKRKNQTGGYKWYYADDPEQPDKTKIILNENK